jgi:hypothetical protein
MANRLAVGRAQSKNTSSVDLHRLRRQKFLRTQTSILVVPSADDGIYLLSNENAVLNLFPLTTKSCLQAGQSARNLDEVLFR